MCRCDGPVLLKAKAGFSSDHSWDFWLPGLWSGTREIHVCTSTASCQVPIGFPCCGNNKERLTLTITNVPHSTCLVRMFPLKICFLGFNGERKRGYVLTGFRISQTFTREEMLLCKSIFHLPGFKALPSWTELSTRALRVKDWFN